MKILDDIIKYGWKSGIDEVWNANCIDALKLIPDESIDIIITDPSYGINYMSTRPAKLKRKDYIIGDTLAEVTKLINTIIPQLIRIMTVNSEIYWFSSGGGNIPCIPTVWMAFREYEPSIYVKNLLIWNKQYMGLGWDWRYQYETIFQIVKGKGIKNIDKYASNIINAKKIIPQCNNHPIPKSVEVITEIIKRKPCKLILDPFLGSGTTMIAARKYGIHSIGIELDKKYCEMAENNLRYIIPRNIQNLEKFF